METNTETNRCLSGGETEDSAEYAALRSKILAEPDVYEVLALSFVPPEQRWLYLIKTPFATFPKYVIGYTDSDLAEPEILFSCGAEWSARAEWDKLNFGDHP